MIKFYPRRPVKSFQDLEIYQKLLASGVELVKRTQNCQTEPILDELIKTPLIKHVLELPKIVAKAHSIRFSDFEEAQKELEKAMLNCNLVVVHLELFRDLCDYGHKNGTTGQESENLDNNGTGTAEFFAEHIKTYLAVRFKIMHLQKSWKKFKEIQ